MSEYKRLTRYFGEVMQEDCRNCNYAYNNVCNYKDKENKIIYDIDEDCKKVMLNRLAELEDKIENGTLIERPPVKKGDSIWLIRAKRDYLDGRYRKIVWRCVDKIFLNNDNTYTISTISVSSGGYKNRSIVKSTTFKKSWFLTKAEAEARLKELQEKQK